MGTKVDYNTYRRAVSSVNGRLARLNKIPATRHNGFNEQPTAIRTIGIFEQEVSAMDDILNSMQKRLANAKITVELDN